MILPIELIICIYKLSDRSTRIKINKIFKWSYYLMNPFYDEIGNELLGN